MKKIHLILSIIIFILSINTIKVYAIEASGVVNQSYNGKYNISWHYKDGVLTLSPSEPTSYIIIKAEDNTHWGPYKNDITKIIIEDGIDAIRNNAFSGYTNLEEVIFPKSMGGYIGDYAFYNCSKLKSIELPIGLTKIGDYAFYGTGITEVELPIFVSWTEEHTFNDNTNITRPEEYDNIIAAGTAGKLRSTDELSREGKPQENTCYIKFYFQHFYDDTAYWKLEKDGTLTVWGTDLVDGYTGSRVPWGCYKDDIKKIVFNDDKTGTIKVDDKECNKNKNVKLAVYVSKPIEEIMNNRIKELNGQYTSDC
jgi:hypothetical protein